MKRSIVLVMALVILVSMFAAMEAAAVGKYCIAYWRECAAYENQSPPAGAMGNHSCYIHIWNENGTPRAGVMLYTSWGVHMGTTNADGYVEATLYRPNGYDFQVRDGSNLSDTSPIFNQERGPNWGHYSYEVGFMYKADSNNPGTFDTAYDGVLNISSDQPCNLDAPRTRSLAFYSTDPLNLCSDNFGLGNWSDSFGQTFVANGNRVVAARCHPTLGNGSHLWYSATIHQGGPTGAQIGPAATSREVVSDEYAPQIVRWGINDVPVTAGQTYYVKFTRVGGGGMNVYHVYANNYASGQYYENTTGFSGVDLQGMVVCCNTTGGGPTTGVISGNVKNTSAQNISGATVSTTTGGYTGTTDANGNYTLSNVVPGTYSVAASKAGYVTNTQTGKTVTAGQTTTVNFTLTASQGGSIATEDFEVAPSWSSSFDAAWGSAATWTITAGGQAGNFLQVSRSTGGSSVKAKVYTVPTNTDITISCYMKCPSYGSSYWMEFAYRFGNNAASDFDANGAAWTMIRKFANDGVNGNGNAWTQYSTTVNTGSNTQITIGYKLGASGAGPTVGWDSFQINGPAGCTSPAITTQPSSQTKCVGQSVTFTVAASGTAPLSYQWKKNGTNISGATSTSYTISSVTTGDAANYTCYVSNSCGNVTSNAAALTVNTAPSITTHPVSQTKNVGESCTFTVAASGTAPLSYQWRKNSTNISGATSSSYTIASVQTTDAGSYDCVVTNGCGSATSNAASLTVNGGTIASEDFTTMPTWSSSFDASWGSAATWTVPAGGQSGNFLQCARSAEGSSVKAKVYTVPANTNITISGYMKCPNYTTKPYWMEFGFRFGSQTAQDFDANGGSWTMIKKFSDSGINGNGNVWTQYSYTVNTGSNTQITIGYKLGSSGGAGPTVGWDTFRIQ